jgi:alkylhydroperoxidase/carboxymuconolactone decarboxylase family protein YurZ
MANKEWRCGMARKQVQKYLRKQSRFIFKFFLLLVVTAFFGSGITAGAQASEQYLQWNRKTLAEAYLRVGKRDKAWDEKALGVLESAALMASGSPNAKSYPELAASAKAAMDAGCNDPLITFLCGLSLYRMGKISEAEPLLQQSIIGMETLKYPACRQMLAARFLARICYFREPGNTKEVKQWISRAIQAGTRAAMNGEYPNEDKALFIIHLGLVMNAMCEVGIDESVSRDMITAALKNSDGVNPVLLKAWIEGWETSYMFAKAWETSVDSRKSSEEKSKTAAERMWKEQLPMIGSLQVFDKEFADITIEGIFNGLYGREDRLDLKTRELCTVTILTSLNKPEELNMHLLAAVNLGWTFKELREIMILCSLPAGWPSSLEAVKYLYSWCGAHNIPKEPPLEMRKNYHTADWYQIGYDKGIELFGEKSWRKYLNELSILDPDLSKFVVINFYGKLLTRPTLDDRTRELCYVAAFGALKDKRNLELHIRGSLNSGATPDEIKEILFHIGCYAGIDTVSQAIDVYKGMNIQ